MKEHDVKLTLQETEQLCRLYMDCRLTVLEETELQYVLGKMPYSSPCIDEVRMLMGVLCPSKNIKTSKKSFRLFRNNTTISIAASFAVLFAIGIFLQIRQPENSTSSLSNRDDHVYIAAYSHGQRLNGDKAAAATEIAMAKADSLMRYASLAERDYMMKANDIISATTDN